MTFRPSRRNGRDVIVVHDHPRAFTIGSIMAV